MRVPVEGEPGHITYPHPNRTDLVPCGARIDGGMFGVHQACRRPPGHDGLHQPYPDTCTCARCTGDAEPVESTPATCCGQPVADHDVLGTCPIPT